jgi:peptidoglycan hydrolase CwlO-like protein
MALANSIKSKDLGALEAALEKANEVGLSAHPEVASATESKATLLKEVAADEALAAAMATAAAAPGDEAATTALRRCASLFLCV